MTFRISQEALSRFLRRLETEYEVQVTAGIARGLSDDEAHNAAFEHLKRFGVEALERLRYLGIEP